MLLCIVQSNQGKDRQPNESIPIAEYVVRTHSTQYQKGLQIVPRRSSPLPAQTHHFHPPLQLIISMDHDELQSHYDFPDSQTLKLGVATSILPNAGLGLFATDSFSKGELVAEYYGSVTTAKHSESSVFDSEDKMVQADQQYCLISRGPASRANDIVDFRPADYLSACFQEYRANRRLPVIKGAAHNAKLSMESRQKVFIKATRNIAAGEEILIDYGFDYWFFFYQQCNPNRDLPI